MLPRESEPDLLLAQRVRRSITRRMPGMRLPLLCMCLSFESSILLTLLFLRHRFFLSLSRCPVCGPVSVAEDLFTRMRCELDHYRPARYTQQLGADIDDCSTESQPLFGRATTTKLDHNHGDRLKAIESEVIKIVRAELGDPDIRSPQLRLHHFRVQLAKPCRQFAFYLDGICPR